MMKVKPCGDNRLLSSFAARPEATPATPAPTGTADLIPVKLYPIGVEAMTEQAQKSNPKKKMNRIENWISI